MGSGGRWRFCGCCAEGGPQAGPSRRGFLKVAAGMAGIAGAAAMGGALGGGFGAGSAFAQTSLPGQGSAAAPGGAASGAAGRYRIDVHHHVSPPSWLDAIKSVKKDTPPQTNWSVQKSLDDMEKGGVQTAITSVFQPQTTVLDRDIAARVARESNEWAKKLESEHPGRFGTFAMLPLPHVDESLKAIEYAFDTLKVDGIGCLTNYGDKWLGYSEFEPVWAELNRRKAVVYTHPVGPDCCVNLVRGLDEAYIEFGTDTTRTIGTILFGGVSQKYPDIQWIFSHGGGALTAFAERFLVQAPSRPPYAGKWTREMVQGQLDRYFYDTAQVANPVTLSAMVKLMPISQIVYGTDYPYRTALDHTKGLGEFFKDEDLKKIGRENALRLLPRLRSA